MAVVTPPFPAPPTRTPFFETDKDGKPTGRVTYAWLRWFQTVASQFRILAGQPPLKG